LKNKELDLTKYSSSKKNTAMERRTTQNELLVEYQQKLKIQEEERASMLSDIQPVAQKMQEPVQYRIN